MKPHDLAGRRVGRLTVVSFSGSRGGKRMWRCLCDCGKETLSSAGNLVSGRSSSCGCAAKEKTIARSTRHGGSHSPEYAAWRNMLARCECPGSSSYPRYGGAGISVCPEWHSFEQFLSDLGPRPTSRHSVDRIDNSRGYEPANCRWSTPSQQAGNRKGSILVEFGGAVCPLKEACAVSGADYRRALYRFRRHGELPVGMRLGAHPAVSVMDYHDQEAKALCADGCREETIYTKDFVPVRADGGAIHPHRLICLNTLQRGSWLFNSVWDPAKHDAMCAYGQLKDGRWRVSLYSTKEEVDCGAIAKVLGGGGHKGAAGFICDELPWSKA